MTILKIAFLISATARLVSALAEFAVAIRRRRR